MDLDFSTAPDAAIEDHGIQARGRSFWGEVLAPSTASDGWSLFILFRDHIVKRAPWSVHEVNLKTGVVTPHAGVWDEPSQIHAFSDGRVSVMRGPSCLRLNAKTQSFEKIAVPRGAYWYWRPAREGMVFLCCADDGRVARLNTETDEVLDFGLVGQGGGGLLARMWEYGDVTGEGEILTPFGVDDHAAFVVLGQLPRTLWALNLETREQRMLLCVADPDRMAILQREKGCFALVRRREGDEVYRLTAEKAEGVKRLPPRDPESAPMVAGIPRPEIPPRLAMPVGDYQGTGMCEADGTATVHYRPSGEDWKTASIDLTDYPSYLFRMGSTSDGRLLCSSEDPYTIFTFDPGSSTCEILDRPRTTPMPTPSPNSETGSISPAIPAPRCSSTIRAGPGPISRLVRTPACRCRRIRTRIRGLSHGCPGCVARTTSRPGWMAVCICPARRRCRDPAHPAVAWGGTSLRRAAPA